MYFILTFFWVSNKLSDIYSIIWYYCIFLSPWHPQHSSLFLYLSISILSLINKVLFENFDKRHLCLSCCTMKVNIWCTTARSSSWVHYSSLSIHYPWLCALSCYTSYGSTPKPSACSFLYLDHFSTDISVFSSCIHCCIYSNLPL